MQKHKKTHKNGKQQTEIGDETVSSDVVTTISDGQDLSTLTDGQHFFYVTSDQSQLLITTIADETGLTTGANIEYDSSLIALPTESQQVDLANLDNCQKDVMDSQEGDCVLAVVSEEGSEEGPDGNQTIEYITQDGNCIRISLPSNVDPYANVSEYFTDLN